MWNSIDSISRGAATFPLNVQMFCVLYFMNLLKKNIPSLMAKRYQNLFHRPKSIVVTTIFCMLYETFGIAVSMWAYAPGVKINWYTCDKMSSLLFGVYLCQQREIIQLFHARLYALCPQFDFGTAVHCKWYISIPMAYRTRNKGTQINQHNFTVNSKMQWW